MIKHDLMEMLTTCAKEYRADALASVTRNRHMNHLPENPQIEANVIDALLVDFINYVGRFQGLDYGLYTKDLDVVPTSELSGALSPTMI